MWFLSLFLVKLTKSFILFMQCVPKIALVTGAALGYGRATASLLLSKGYIVACCDSAFNEHTNDDNLLREVQGEGKALFYELNSLSSDSVGSSFIANNIGYSYTFIDKERIQSGTSCTCQLRTIHYRRTCIESNFTSPADDKQSTEATFTGHLCRGHQQECCFQL